MTRVNYSTIRHIDDKPGILPDPVITKFRRRIYEDDNDVFLIIAGKRGSTKSGCGISMGYQLDLDEYGRSRFYLDKKYFPKKFSLNPGERMPRVIYYPSQLLDMLKNHHKYPMGTCVLWDEVGVGGDAREFATKKNKLLKRAFQTIRDLNWFITLTAITKKDYDIAFDRVSGFWMRTGGKTMLTDGVNKMPYGKVKVYEIDVNAKTAKDFDKFLNYTDVDGREKALKEWYYIKKPPAGLEKPYKRYKRIFQTTLYKDYSNQMEDIESYSIDEETKSELDVMTEKKEEILANMGDYFDYKKNKFVLAAVQFNGDTKIESEPKARKLIQLLNFEISKGKIAI